jgi:hypothetical protein
MLVRLFLITFFVSFIKYGYTQSTNNFADLPITCYGDLHLGTIDSSILKNNVRGVHIYRLDSLGNKKLLEIKKFNEKGCLEKLVDYYDGSLSDSLVYNISRPNKKEIQVKVFLGENAFNETFEGNDEFYHWPTFFYVLDSSRRNKKNTVSMYYYMNKDSNYNILTFVNNSFVDSSVWGYCCVDTTIKSLYDTVFIKDTMLVIKKSSDSTKVKDYYIKNLLVKTEVFKPYVKLVSLTTDKYDKKERLIENLRYLCKNNNRFIKYHTKKISYNDTFGTRTETEYDDYDLDVKEGIQSITSIIYDSLNREVSLIVHHRNYTNPEKPIFTTGEKRNLINKNGLVVNELHYFNDVLIFNIKYEYTFKDNVTN